MSDPTTRAIRYAEDVLGTEAVRAAAEEAQQRLHAAHGHLRDARRARREVEEHMAEREMALYTLNRPDFESQNAFDKGIRPIVQQDTDMRALRAAHRDTQDAQDLADHEVSECEYALRLCAARMIELGGLLTFYGAIKTTPNNTNTIRESDTT